MATVSPRISIITATFNAAEQLPHTMRSLREQTFMEFEWIVVDGNSTDGTQALLQENDDLVSRCISEPDRGIYDAFNKGCALARGEWLLFLGAGDELSSPQTLAECDKNLGSINAETTLVYGRLTLLSPVARAALETYGEPWDEIKHRWDNGRPAMPPHGAAFHRRSLFNDSQFFDLRFPIAADSHFMFRISRLYAPVFMPIDVTLAPVGGISYRLDTQRQLRCEIAAINRDLGLTPPFRVRLIEWFKIVVISMINLFPPKVAHRVADVIRFLLGKPALWTVR